MAYTPPNGFVNASWVGSKSYPGAWERTHASWQLAGGDVVAPAGVQSLRIGTQFVTGTQFIVSLGHDQLVHGTGLVARGTDYIAPYLDVNAAWAGKKPYDIPPDLSRVSWAYGSGEVQLVLPEGLESCAFGAPVAHWNQQLTLDGFDSAQFGSAAVAPPPVNASWAGAPGYEPPSGVLNAHWGYKYGNICAYGWRDSVVGRGGSIRSHISRADNAGAIPPANGYGTHSVWLYTRYITPKELHSQAFGTQWASHWLRYLTAVGAGDRLVNGTQWASHSPRTLSPSGIDSFRLMESHAVGGTQGIFAEGTDMTQWGTRIIPEGQTLYVSGFSGEFGVSDVQLYKRFVAPQGFATYRDDLRFGSADVWNLRQYVRQDFDPNDGLNPQEFGAWTAIENRNKEPVPVGWVSERFGYQFIWNKASAVLPAGMSPPADLPTYKAGSVTHWQRFLSPGGIDSLASDRWHTAYNNADLIRPYGVSQIDFGGHGLENRSRQYEKVGNFDSAQVGVPFIADAIRELTFESRYSVEPPPLPLPDVKLHTRYLEYVAVGDISGAGIPVLDIRWTYITPRWAFHPPAWIGEPALRNVTPELHTGGMNHEEFGSALIRTKWRRVETTDGDMTLWGRPIVRDRRQWAEFVTLGAPPTMLPGPKVTKIGGLPEAQAVRPTGITPANGAVQVPKPQLSILFSYPEGFDSAKFGDTVVTANSIRVEPGYGATSFGQPEVTALRRVLRVGKFPEDMVFQPSKPSLSPHTIYAVMEAPPQARENHPLTHGSYHYVGYGETPAKDVGVPAVTNRLRSIKPVGFTYFEYLSWPRPSVENARRYVAVDGLNSFKRGIPTIPGTQEVRVFDQGFQDAFGKPAVAPPPYVGPVTLLPNGVPPPAFSSGNVDFLQRVRKLDGWDSMSMGGSLLGDKPYQWRGLHVGVPMPTIPKGFLAESVGEPWVSLAVRDVAAVGWESSKSEYDIDNFEQRMRVTKTLTPRPARALGASGFVSCVSGAPDIRPAAHYIRPDGNAEAYRKGAP